MSSPAITAKRRAPLPEGTIPVGIALLVGGVATFAFFKVGQKALGGDEQFRPISAMWFATFALAPGCFLPLEQELGRALASRRARGEGGRPVVSRIRLLGAAIAAAVVAALLVLSAQLTKHYFDGNWWMLAALITAFVAYAPAHIARGICSGNGRFHSYAVIIGSDGVVRIVVCVLFAMIGITNPAPYAFAVALSPLVAVLAVGLKGRLHTEPGPPAPFQEVSQNLGWLVIGTLMAGVLLNAGPVTANLIGADSDKKAIQVFSYGVLVARLPLFMFQAVQAALLPRLARLAARGEYDEFKAGFRRLMALVAIVGVVGTVGAYILGGFIVDTMFNVHLTGSTMAMLALSSALYMGALATAQAVVALHGHAWVAFGWALAVVTYIIGIWLASDLLFRRIEIALVISSLTALASFTITLRRRLARGAAALGGAPVGPLPGLPLET